MLQLICQSKSREKFSLTVSKNNNTIKSSNKRGTENACY